MTVPASLPVRRRARNSADAVPSPEALLADAQQLQHSIAPEEEGDPVSAGALAQLFVHPDGAAVIRAIAAAKSSRCTATMVQLLAFHGRHNPEQLFDLLPSRGAGSAALVAIAALWRREWEPRVLGLLTAKDDNRVEIGLRLYVHVAWRRAPVSLELYEAAMWAAIAHTDKARWTEAVWTSRENVATEQPKAKPARAKGGA